MLKFNCLIISLLFFAAPLRAQQINIKTSKALKDSVYQEYVTDKAAKYSYFHPKWQLFLDSAIAITPDNGALWELKSMPYDKARKYEVGEKYLNIAVALDPYEYTGLRAFQKCIFYKRYREALADYDTAVKLRGDFTMMEHTYSFYQGLCYLNLNEFDSAMKYFDKACETERKNGGEGHIHFMNWFYRGIVFMEKANYEAAITEFDKTLARYPNFSDVLYYKSICLLRLKKVDEALALMDKAKLNFKKGYSFTEDNAIYEKYPYQLNAYQMR